MLKKSILILWGIFLLANISLADGLLMPVNEYYPKDFLRNRLTRVNVNIHGLTAETTVYQEFEHEGYDSTDAVYSFPLPPGARATEFVYWYEGQIYKAVLKVKEQSTNPGTGEGGVAAEVNKYIGRNGIKVALKGIQPGTVQKVQLHYISRLDYYQGRCTYKFPLKTEKFVKHTLDLLQFNINVDSNSEINSFDIPTHSGLKVLQSDQSSLKIELVKSKTFVTKNFEFYYDVNHTDLGVDFYSCANDTIDGHFALFVRPQAQALPDSVFPKRMFFLLSNSSSMFGYKLDQSKDAIASSLDKLSSIDEFNLVLFNYTAVPWRSVPVAATALNIQAAKSYLETVNISSGTRMDLGIKNCLNQISDDDFSNAILVFTDGMSPIGPREIETLNTFKTGIFPIGMGDRVSRERLEMTAALNYGFVTYILDDDNFKELEKREWLDTLKQYSPNKYGIEAGIKDCTWHLEPFNETQGAFTLFNSSMDIINYLSEDEMLFFFEPKEG